jgi:glutathione S-transferase
MDLYMIPFTCSFAAHIACLEAGVPHTLQYVDRKTKRLDDGRDYLALTSKGAVPALALPDHTVLTESAAVLQYLADTAPDSGLAPRAGTRERYQLIEWLNFITTELHKKHVWMIFSTKTTPEMKSWARESMPLALAIVARHLEGREFVMGDTFTVADAYLYWILFVAPHGGVALDPWPSLVAYVARMREREAVKRAFAIEAPLYAREQKAA